MPHGWIWEHCLFLWLAMAALKPCWFHSLLCNWHILHSFIFLILAYFFFFNFRKHHEFYFSTGLGYRSPHPSPESTEAAEMSLAPTLCTVWFNSPSLLHQCLCHLSGGACLMPWLENLSLSLSLRPASLSYIRWSMWNPRPKMWTNSLSHSTR